ncbi:MAG: hypothetical protein ACR2LJ_07585 [Acidimicrobiales bacterium]
MPAQVQASVQVRVRAQVQVQVLGVRAAPGGRRAGWAGRGE